MSTFKRVHWISALLLLLPMTALHARATLTVVSNEPGTVFLDEEAVGQSPLTLTDVDPGYHHLRLVSRRTGETRLVDVYSPRKATIEKTLQVDFLPDPAPRQVLVERPILVERPVYVSPHHYFGPTFVYPRYRHSHGHYFRY